MWRVAEARLSEEPGAIIPHAGIRAGRGRVTAPSTATGAPRNSDKLPGSALEITCHKNHGTTSPHFRPGYALFPRFRPSYALRGAVGSSTGRSSSAGDGSVPATLCFTGRPDYPLSVSGTTSIIRPERPSYAMFHSRRHCALRYSRPSYGPREPFHADPPAAAAFGHI